MTNEDDLDALIARAEAATGPDRALDVLIGCAVRYAPAKLGCEWASAPHWQYVPVPRISERIGCADKAGNVAAHWEAPAYTASIDAAMTLIPPPIPQDTGVFWRLGNDGEGGDPALFKAQILICTLFTSRSSEGWGDTPALALVAAALKALLPTPSPK